MHRATLRHIGLASESRATRMFASAWVRPVSRPLARGMLKKAIDALTSGKIPLEHRSRAPSTDSRRSRHAHTDARAHSGRHRRQSHRPCGGNSARAACVPSGARPGAVLSAARPSAARVGSDPDGGAPAVQGRRSRRSADAEDLDSAAPRGRARAHSGRDLRKPHPFEPSAQEPTATSTTVRHRVARRFPDARSPGRDIVGAVRAVLGVTESETERKRQTTRPFEGEAQAGGNADSLEASPEDGDARGATRSLTDGRFRPRTSRNSGGDLARRSLQRPARVAASSTRARRLS